MKVDTFTESLVNDLTPKPHIGMRKALMIALAILLPYAFAITISLNVRSEIYWEAIAIALIFFIPCTAFALSIAIPGYRLFQIPSRLFLTSFFLIGYLSAGALYSANQHGLSMGDTSAPAVWTCSLWILGLSALPLASIVWIQSQLAPSDFKMASFQAGFAAVFLGSFIRHLTCPFGGFYHFTIAHVVAPLGVMIILGFLVALPLLKSLYRRHALTMTKLIQDRWRSSPIQLQNGDEVPQVTFFNNDGQEIDLTQYKGKKVWLMLYRYATCPLCLFHLKNVEKRKDEFKDIEIVPVFEVNGNQDAYQAFGSKENLLALLLPEVTLTLVRALLSGFTQGPILGKLGRKPSHFLIQDGKIETAFYGNSAASQIPWSQVQAFASTSA